MSLEVPLISPCCVNIYYVFSIIMQVGTSSVVYPAAGFAPQLAARGVPVAEFNLEETSVTGSLR